MSGNLIQVKKLFFDSTQVMSAVDRATRRVLSRFGAYVRRSARSSIRKRKRVSAPGKPPSSHTGLLRQFILFSYDARAQSVVVGPAQLNSKRGNTLDVLEHGGVVQGWRRGQPHLVRIAARPFMAPAFEKEQPKLPAMWRDSVKK